jgi:uncharacterized protein (UPF0147 family)
VTFDEMKEHAQILQSTARDTARPLKARMAAAKALAQLRKLAAKPAPTQPLSAYERHQRAQDAQRELETWQRNAESRLRTATTLGRTEEIAAIKQEFRAKGLRAPDDPLTEREAKHLDLICAADPPLENRKITRPAPRRVMTWDEYQDTF